MADDLPRISMLKHLVQLAVYFLLQPGFLPHQKKSQPYVHLNRARFQFDTAAHPRTLEMQRIILPVVADLMTGGELGDERFRCLSCLVERERMRAVYGNMRHIVVVLEVQGGGKSAGVRASRRYQLRAHRAGYQCQ